MKDTQGNEQEFSMASPEKWAEYGRRKQEWIKENGWVSQEAYDQFINKLCDELEL